MQGKVKRSKPSRLIRRQQRAGYFFVLPWVIGFIIFFLEPLLESMWYTLNDVTMGTNGMETTFVGLWNFRHLILEDSKFLMNLWTVTADMLKQVAICNVLSLFIAVMLIQNLRGRTIYGAIFFLPMIMTSGVVYSMVGSAVGSSALSGTGNAYLYGGVSIASLMRQGGISLSVINVIMGIVDSIFAMITNCGVPILLYISGLQKIPVSAYEAARIEGASSWDIFWKITVPKISPIIFLNVVYSIVDSCTAYGKGSEGNIMMKAIQDMGFGQTMKFGMSAAMAWMYFMVIAFFLLLSYLLLGRKANKIEN